MGLSGWPLMLTLLAFVAAPVTVLVFRPGRVRPLLARTSFVAGLLVTGQLAAVLAAGAAANNAFGFYPAWSDLLGTGTVLTAGSMGAPRRMEATALAALAKVPLGSGATFSEIIADQRTNMSTRAVIYVPAAYASADRRLLFPVIELFSGYPGTSASWTNTLSLVRVLNTEIAARRMPPVIAVIPDITVRPPRDTECVDVPGGPSVETLLTRGVHDSLVWELRVQSGRRGWGMTGISTGGYCAVKMALHHPGQYAAAAAMSGYFTALQDATTGDLYRGAARRLYESPTWYVRHNPADATLSLLLTMGGREPGSIRTALAFAAAAPPGMSLKVESLPSGGHSYRVWKILLPAVLDWFGAQLAGPLEPPLTGLHFHTPVLR